MDENKTDKKVIRGENGAKSTLKDISTSIENAADLSEEDAQDVTWSNRPADAFDEITESEPSIEVEDEPPVVQRKAIKNARDLMLDEVLIRAKNASSKLLSHLTGSLCINIFNKKDESYVFTYANGTVDLKENKEGPPSLVSSGSTSNGVNCIIDLSEQILFKIRSGDLNPQIAMLSDKIKVQGEAGLAVYFFSLVAPRVRH